MSEIREILKQVYQSGYDDGVNAKYGIRTKAHLIPDKEKEIIKIILDEIEKFKSLDLGSSVVIIKKTRTKKKD